MSGITTHVLDTARGKPAAGVPVVLAVRRDHGVFTRIGAGKTDADGRLRTLTSGVILAGTYRITFDTAAYFERLGVEAFYPKVSIDFVVHDPAEHFHVPLLVSPFGYSTYRGS